MTGDFVWLRKFHHRAKRSKSFLVLFFKKERLSLS